MLDDLNDLIAKVAQKLPKVKVPWLHQSDQITENESDTVETGIGESGKLSTIHEVSENLVDDDAENTGTENNPSVDQGIGESSEAVDVNQFYVLKTDTPRRNAIRQGICVSNERGPVSSSKSELGENSAFISLEIEAGPCNEQKDRSETNSESQKRKHELDKKLDNTEPSTPKKLKRPQFDSAKVKRLKGNPSKIKKKKKKKQEQVEIRNN